MRDRTYHGTNCPPFDRVAYNGVRYCAGIFGAIAESDAFLPLSVFD
jgi:hypothetical protein